MTRRGLIRFLAAAATAAQSAWPNAVYESKEKEPFVKGSGTSLQLRSMFFSLRSPYVQILCSIRGTAAGGKVKAVRVNDELIPCLSNVAGSYWQSENDDLVIYVEERVVHFDLSRFPDIQVLVTENDPPICRAVSDVRSGSFWLKYTELG